MPCIKFRFIFFFLGIEKFPAPNFKFFFFSQCSDIPTKEYEKRKGFSIHRKQMWNRIKYTRWRNNIANSASCIN